MTILQPRLLSPVETRRQTQRMATLQLALTSTASHALLAQGRNLSRRAALLLCPPLNRAKAFDLASKMPVDEADRIRWVHLPKLRD